MTRPLVDEAGALAAEFARRGVGLVVIDSKMFAVAGGDGAAFHEPITAFYGALRLFAPAASWSSTTSPTPTPRSGGPARPFGGAFAFNGPRLIWEAKRDPDVTDATAIAFTCRKANNLARGPTLRAPLRAGRGHHHGPPLRPDRGRPADGRRRESRYRLKLALAGRAAKTVEGLAEALAHPRGQHPDAP